jgi:hypothetical protein
MSVLEAIGSLILPVWAQFGAKEIDTRPVSVDYSESTELGGYYSTVSPVGSSLSLRQKT